MTGWGEEGWEQKSALLAIDLLTDDELGSAERHGDSLFVVFEMQWAIGSLRSAFPVAVDTGELQWVLGGVGNFILFLASALFLAMNTHRQKHRHAHMCVHTCTRSLSLPYSKGQDLIAHISHTLRVRPIWWQPLMCHKRNRNICVCSDKTDL